MRSLRSLQHQSFHRQALAGLLRIVQNFARRQAIKGGSSEALHVVLRHIVPDSGKGEMEGLYSLITGALAVIESEEIKTAFTPTQPASSPIYPAMTQHDEATMRVRTTASLKPLADDSNSTRTFASGNLPHDDTLGDLVGTLHQLNQFFTEDEGDDYEHQMTTPIRPDRLQMGRTAQVSPGQYVRHGLNMLNWTRTHYSLEGLRCRQMNGITVETTVSLPQSIVQQVAQSVHIIQRGAGNSKHHPTLTDFQTMKTTHFPLQQAHGDIEDWLAAIVCSHRRLQQDQDQEEKAYSTSKKTFRQIIHHYERLQDRPFRR
jgi:hypothetical protein